MKILVLVLLCFFACVIQDDARRFRGSRRGSFSWWPWSKSSPSASISRSSSHTVSKPLHTVSKPSHTVSKPAFSHSYPASSGLSGSHSPQGPTKTDLSDSYPPSSGLSGNSRVQHLLNSFSNLPDSFIFGPGFHIPSTNIKPSHAYPPASGLSGGSIASVNAKPNFNSALSYPSSGGLSGNAPKPPVYNGWNPPANGGVHGPPVYGPHNPPSYSANSPSSYPRNPPSYSAHNPPSYSAHNPPSYSAHNPPLYSAHHPPAYSANLPHHSAYNPPAYSAYHPPAYSAYHPPAYSAYHPPMYNGYNTSMYSGYGYNPSYIKTSSGSNLNNVLDTLMLWNMARSGSSHGTHHYYHHYNHNKNSTQNSPSKSAAAAPVSELSNCTMTFISENLTKTAILIPCEIATSFAPNVKVNDTLLPTPAKSSGESCSISVVRKGVTKNTLIPCDFLSNLQKESNKPLPGKLNCSATNIRDMHAPVVPPCSWVVTPTNEDEFKVIPLAPKPISPLSSDYNSSVSSTPSRFIVDLTVMSINSSASSDLPELYNISTTTSSILPLNNTAI